MKSSTETLSSSADVLAWEPDPLNFSPARRFLRFLFSRTFWGYGLFWSWNLIFVVFAGFGLVPLVLLQVFKEAIEGEMPWGFALTATAVVLLPLASIVAALLFFRCEPGKQLRLFYGVEAPLFLFCLARLFLLRELNPALLTFLAALGLGLFAYLYEMKRDELAGSLPGAVLQLAGHTLLFLLGLYLASILLFYVIPLAYGLLRLFFSFRWVSSFAAGLWKLNFRAFVSLLLGVPLVCYSATLFVALPAMLLGLYGPSWWRMCRKFARRYGSAAAWGVSVVLVLVAVLGFVLANKQPQQRAFALLKKPPQSKGERLRVLHKEGLLRRGLLNAYLAPYRYISSTGENNHIAYFWRDAFQKRQTKAFSWTQQTYNFLARPLLYQGKSMRADGVRAERLYERVFDRPIQKAERKAILHAATSTVRQRRREAGLLSIGERSVYLVRQEVRVKERGDWAQLELHEVYENRTYQQKEFLYYFTLPESAVVTGLWLGESADRRRRYPFVVAPRGAAQRVYRREVRRRIDPALLEQVGPRQYRLRAFPVPPRPRLFGGRRGQARTVATSRTGGPATGGPSAASWPNDPAANIPRLHLWLTYQVWAGEKGWPLPRLVERRNVFWDQRTQRLVNSRELPGRTSWLASFVPFQQRPQRKSHQLRLLGGALLRAVPLGQLGLKQPPSAREEKNQGEHKSKGETRGLVWRGRSLAVVLDRSRSMGHCRRQVETAFAWLKRAIFSQNRVDVYLTASPYRGEKALRLSNVRHVDLQRFVFFGQQKGSRLLQQFARLRQGKRYDLVLVLTDSTGFDLVRKAPPLPSIQAPVWIVHLDGKLSPAYDDATTAVLQKNGGGAETSVQAVFARLALGDFLQAPSLINIGDGYAWYLQRPAPKGENKSKEEKAGKEERASKEKNPPQKTTPSKEANPPQEKSPAIARKKASSPEKTPTVQKDPVNSQQKGSLPQDRGQRRGAPGGEPEPSFTALAARQWILAQLRRGDPRKLGLLDRIHQIAKENHIVSPYSSMLVLINQRQREALRRESKKRNRFQRQQGSGKTRLQKPGNPFHVGATPEPEEWLLLGLVALALLWLARRQKRSSSLGCALSGSPRTG